MGDPQRPRFLTLTTSDTVTAFPCITRKGAQAVSRSPWTPPTTPHHTLKSPKAGPLEKEKQEKALLLLKEKRRSWRLLGLFRTACVL